jgi:phosphate-selective porin OprO and OprP
LTGLIRPTSQLEAIETTDGRLTAPAEAGQIQKEQAMKLKQILIPAVLVLAITAVLPARADEQTELIKRLEQKVAELDQKVRILERKNELDKEAAVERAKTTPTVTIGAAGFSVGSADSNFVAQIHGVLQVDNRTFFHDKNIPGNDAILLRRARPIISGTLFKDFDYQFVPDFGGSSPSIYDAYLNYRFRPELQLRAGKFKVPVGLEQLQQDVNTSFNERSLVTSLVPNRDLGFQFWGDIAGGVASYAVGVFNGVGDARNSLNTDFEDNREFAGRLFFQPFKNSAKLPALQGLGFGAGGSTGNTVSNATGLPGTTGGTLAGYATDGQQQFFAYNPSGSVVVANGTHWRLSPQAYYYYGPFSLLAEYAISDQGVCRTNVGASTVHLRNTGWEVTAGWVLTGEKASFSGVTPRKPFNFANGDWGAVQLVGRYAMLDIDDKAFPLYSNPASSASEACAWAVGLNWYLNKNLRFSTSYAHTDFSGGGTSTAMTSPAAVTRQSEDVWFTRVQLSF